MAANRLAPGTDVIIELGGEDAKILFLTNGMEVRMNGSCAGGTGAFIDQMATLLKMGAGGDGQSRPDSGKDLHHRRPLRRVCQERHPAPHQPGGQVRRHRQEHLSGGGEPDHRGSGPGTAHQGPRSVSGRAADLFQVSAAELRRDLGRHRNLSGEQPAVCGPGRGVLRRGIVGPAENGGAVGAARHVGDLPLPAAPL